MIRHWRDASMSWILSDSPSFVLTENHLRIRLIRLIRLMGWLRSVGSIKLYVFFVECRLFNRSLLQKRPIILSILLTKATPDEWIVIGETRESHCNTRTLQHAHAATHTLQHTHCNTYTLQHTHCNMRTAIRALQHTHRNTHTATHTRQHTHGNTHTLQHTHYNTHTHSRDLWLWSV